MSNRGNPIKRLGERIVKNEWAFLNSMADLPGTVYATPTGRRFHFIDGGEDAKILLVAHCDSVQGSNFLKVDKRKVYSPSLDNRIGVWLTLSELPARGIKADVLLTTDEEMGASTASLFAASAANTKKYNWIGQFDRMGYDAALYQYSDPELSERVRKHGYSAVNGSYTCICKLEDLGVKGINFGVAYNNYHSVNSYIWLNELYTLIDMFEDFYNEFKDVAMPHTRAPAKPYPTTTYTRSKYYGGWGDEDWYGEQGSLFGKGNGSTAGYPKSEVGAGSTKWKWRGEYEDEGEEGKGSSTGADTAGKGQDEGYIMDDSAYGICEGCDEAFHAHDLHFDQTTASILCDNCMKLMYGTSAEYRIDMLASPDPILCDDCHSVDISVKPRSINGNTANYCDTCAKWYLDGIEDVTAPTLLPAVAGKGETL